MAKQPSIEQDGTITEVGKCGDKYDWIPAIKMSSRPVGYVQQCDVHLYYDKGDEHKEMILIEGEPNEIYEQAKPIIESYCKAYSDRIADLRFPKWAIIGHPEFE